MPFKPCCPKCGAQSVHIERDRRARTPPGDFSDLIFSCRCGKQIFGSNVIAELDRQRSEWESTAAARSERMREREQRDAGRREQQDQVRVAVARQSAERKRVEADAAQSRREHEEPQPQSQDQVPWAERFTHADADEPAGDGGAGHDEGDGHTCAWGQCTNPRRKNSVYCSRECSNRNARWRHSQRKRSERTAA